MTFLVGNWAKFGIGALTIMFDILFIVQHFILFPKSKSKPNLNTLRSVQAQLGTINVNFISDQISFQNYDKNKT